MVKLPLPILISKGKTVQLRNHNIKASISINHVYKIGFKADSHKEFFSLSFVFVSFFNGEASHSSMTQLLTNLRQRFNEKFLKSYG
jgi:hypothetical protein